jgi:putative SOS response-associated peptidase YedK
MCGRVRLSSDYSEIKIRLKFDLDATAPNFEPDWNKPPTAPMLVAIRSVDGKRIPKMMKWGLIPRWAKDEKIQCVSAWNKDPVFGVIGIQSGPRG